ncbi:MAG: ThuA domain-containing protein, partial [Clostridia bacterium]|nr:ThuA domain-containing protein [Clostridia bacterium]
HHSKPFKLLMGTTCHLSWREDGDRERVWVCAPAHPIVQGIDRYIELEHEETYAEPFDIPEPDQTILIGSYEGSEVFRSGCCYNRGNGKIFYFQPGHESFPTFHNKDVQTIIKNAVRWAKPEYRCHITCPNISKIVD